VVRLRTNLVANFTGQGAIAVIQMAIIPVYIRWLGVEAYGLIGFQITLQALTQALDFGLSPTVNRELARYSAIPGKANEARDFVRTLEFGYWLIGGAIGLAIYIAAPFLSVHWLQRSTLPAPVVGQAIAIMALLIAVQWPLTFYQGGLLGLQRHAPLNILKVTMAATAAVGGYVVVHVSPTITAFLWWQSLVSLVHVALVTALLWHHLPASTRAPHVKFSAVGHIRGFAAGMTIITFTALILTQLDRLILSRVVSLEQFGCYVVAGFVSSGLSTVVRPMFASIFPRFSSLAVVSDAATLASTYRRGWQLMLVLIVPAAAVIAAFSTELLFLWTRSHQLAQAAGPVAAFLIVGTALNGLMTVPYALQLAYGWTTLGVKINVLLTALAVPAIIVAARSHGTLGAAMVWPSLMALYMLMALPITHRTLLPGLGVRWFLRDVFVPVCVCALIVVLCRIVMPAPRSMWWIVIDVGVSLVASVATLVLTNGDLRRDARHAASKLARQAQPILRAGRVGQL
jgi:O-antigen/teichoic acid export membrane protein